MKSRVVQTFIFLLLSLSFSSHAHALTISGSDTITASGSSQYTASGCSSTVTWGVTNPGASINPTSGTQITLSTNSACGTVLLAARCSADGVIATKGVRVDCPNNSCWVLTGSCNNGGGYDAVVEVIVGGMKRRTGWAAVCAPYYETCEEGGTPGNCNNTIYRDISPLPAPIPPCSAWGQLCFIRQFYYWEWRCPSNSCPYNIIPQAQEACSDLIDNNCNGQVDEGCPVCADNDGDGHYAISGNCLQGDDCNDNDPNIVQYTYYRDVDGDGYGDPNNTTQACSPPAGYVTNNTDCYDNDNAIHPGAIELCGDDIDSNCDTYKDKNCQKPEGDLGGSPPCH